MLKVKRITALIMAILLLATFTGCKKTPDADSEYSIIYITRPNGEEGDSEDIGDAISGDSSASSDKNNSSSNKPSNNPSNNTSSGGRDAYKDNNSRLRDLKGRKIVFIQTWDATDRASEAGKLIAKVEKMLNCKFEERKTTNYTNFYASILSGKPIADLFVPKDRSLLNMAYNNMLTPLDELSDFDFKEDCWDQQCLKDNTLNGHIYGMSRNKQWREILFYNKDMFKKNNWPDLFELQEAGKLDWDTLYSIMEKAVKVTDYGLVPLYGYEYFANDMLLANGVYSVQRIGDSDKFKNNFISSTPVMNALNTAKKWADLPKGLYDTSNGGWDSGRTVFYSGKAAMAIIDSNMLSVIEDNADFEWGCVLFPHGPDSKRDLYIHNTTATAIPAGVKNPNDVALFWDILRDEFKESFGEEYSIGTEYDKSYYITLNKYFKGCQSGYSNYDFSKEMGITAEVEKFMRGQTTAAAAVETVRNTIDAKMKNYWG